MPADLIRSQYESLDQIAKSFGQEAAATRQLLSGLKQKVQMLQQGQWEGENAARFYAEVEASVWPALNRLASALEAARKATTQIAEKIRQAEQDAAALFGWDGGEGRADSSGGSGSEDSHKSSGSGGSGGGSGDDGSGGHRGQGNAEDSEPVRKIQALIDKGDMQGAINEAIKHYGIDTSSMNGWPTYDPDLEAEGTTFKDRSVRIGKDAFRSPGFLAATLGHESIHIKQSVEERWYTDRQGSHMNEIEAYDWQIRNAAHFGLTEGEILNLKERRYYEHYDYLTSYNKKLVDSGKYDPY